MTATTAVISAPTQPQTATYSCTSAVSWASATPEKRKVDSSILCPDNSSLARWTRVQKPRGQTAPIARSVSDEQDSLEGQH